MWSNYAVVVVSFTKRKLETYLITPHQNEEPVAFEALNHVVDLYDGDEPEECVHAQDIVLVS